MKILLTNDDGYQSAGLALLCEKLSSLGHEVYVVAPSGQRSAFSHAVNFHKDLEIAPLTHYCGAKQAFTCSGTPVDCIKFAVSELKVQFDLLISGPNNGENYGECVLYSGTVGAAEEGAQNGIKSVALSRLGRGGSFYPAVEYVVSNLQQLAQLQLNKAFVNVNVPDLSLDEIKGVKVCKQSTSQLYHDFMVKSQGKNLWLVDGYTMEETDCESDVYWANQGYVTLTVLNFDRTDYQQLAKLEVLAK